MSRFAKLAALVAVVCSVQGCAYMHCRANDFLDIVDVGLTFTDTPQFAAYADAFSLVPVGYGDVQGNFIGIGEGQFCGWSTHREHSVGIIGWGHEEVGFGYPDLNSLSPEEKERALNFQHVGVIGLYYGPLPQSGYAFTCVHYLHLGYVGVVASIKWLQALDFIVGWTAFDICADDDPARPLVALAPQKALPPAAPGPATPAESPAPPVK